MELPTFKKLPLGGLDRRALVGALASDGPRVARELLERQKAAVKPAGTKIAPDAAVLILGGSNGITRALAVQLLFGERAKVFGVHFDSEKMQIGGHHVKAMVDAANAEGLTARFWNEDATKPATLEMVAGELKSAGVRTVHVVNGIAAGATKRYAEHGPTKVKDVDVSFDAVLQVPDFSKPENVRQIGLVDVEVATDVDIERTNKFMGTSSLVWAEALGAAGLLARGESIVAFCDYDFEADDPVYGMGPLAGAKKLQRESMAKIRETFGVTTARLCYPPVATTALGAIPGGLMMYALSAQILKERSQYKDLPELARESMEIWRPGYAGADVRIDAAYQACLPEFHARKHGLGQNDGPTAFKLLFG